MLGPNLNFGCGRWSKINKNNLNQESKQEETLEEAQLANMKDLATKLQLSPGMTVLDIGCGYGSFARYLSINFQVSVVGVNICAEEVEHAAKFHDPNVKIYMADYRDLLSTHANTFDRVAAIQMLEHAGGPKVYKEFFSTVRQYLKPNGRLVLQSTIGNYPNPIRIDEFTRKHLFGHSIMPYTWEVEEELREDFVIEQVESLGLHYGETLLAFIKNVEKAWPTLSNKIDEKYYRMLTLFARLGVFAYRYRKLDVWQVVATKRRVIKKYKAVS